LFRRQGSLVATLAPILHAIDSNSQYEVEIRTGFEKAPPKTMSGRELSGLQISLPDRPSSALVFYRRK